MKTKIDLFLLFLGAFATVALVPGIVLTGPCTVGGFLLSYKAASWLRAEIFPRAGGLSVALMSAVPLIASLICYKSFVDWIFGGRSSWKEVAGLPCSPGILLNSPRRRFQKRVASCFRWTFSISNVGLTCLGISLYFKLEKIDWAPFLLLLGLVYSGHLLLLLGKLGKGILEKN